MIGSSPSGAASALAADPASAVQSALCIREQSSPVAAPSAAASIVWDPAQSHRINRFGMSPPGVPDVDGVAAR